MKHSSIRLHMPIPLNKAIGLIVCGALCSPVFSHDDGQSLMSEHRGFKLDAMAVLGSRWAAASLPSQGLPGYLLLGDPGVDLRGGQLEHAMLQAAYRGAAWWGARLALGVHGAEPWHVQTAVVDFGGEALALRLGRQSLALGGVMTPGGHLDRFGLMPLAKAVVFDGDGVDDGVQLALQSKMPRAVWRADVGLWSGQRFPGSAGSGPAPSMHLGVQWHNAWGQWAVDGVGAQLSRVARGPVGSPSVMARTAMPRRFAMRVWRAWCVWMAARVGGVSADQWRGGALALHGALLWRREQGTLQSRNGLGQYAGTHRGDWMELAWQMHPAWESALRYERLKARHTLVGAGASLVATEAGFDRYAPQRRTSAMLGYQMNPWMALRVEVGQERADERSVRFAALRWVLRWEKGGWGAVAR